MCCVILMLSSRQIPGLVLNLVSSILSRPLTSTNGRENRDAMRLPVTGLRHSQWGSQEKRQLSSRNSTLSVSTRWKNSSSRWYRQDRSFRFLPKTSSCSMTSRSLTHFSNECDMLNRIVLGMTAKQFRLANDIEKGKSIRPYLSKEQIDMLETLQKVDENVFCRCPSCGSEVQVDLAEVFSDGDGDLFGTSVLCDSCSRKMMGGKSCGSEQV